MTNAGSRITLEVTARHWPNCLSHGPTGRSVRAGRGDHRTGRPCRRGTSWRSQARAGSRGSSSGTGSVASDRAREMTASALRRLRIRLSSAPSLTSSISPVGASRPATSWRLGERLNESSRPSPLAVLIGRTCEPESSSSARRITSCSTNIFIDGPERDRGSSLTRRRPTAPAPDIAIAAASERAR
jgi:hypothetical protein